MRFNEKVSRDVFIKAYAESSSASEVSVKLDMPKKAVFDKAAYLRRQGVVIPYFEVDIRKKDTEKFHSKVAKCGLNDCWPFVGAKCSGGYGWVSFEYNLVATHRLAYHLANPEWMLDGIDWVLHKCDNRICCNPNHLFLGDRQGNMDDMKSKGRARKKKGARLTEIDIKEIFILRDRGLSLQEIGKCKGINTNHVSGILNGRRKCWDWLTQDQNFREGIKQFREAMKLV